mmetsp:Transcript_22555/g.51647  ORF Transcript_22555/g.51647 Transcript_22555/m.51647 type:complete len:216 (+) Transcript_22555:501-1148(+)
MSPIRSNSPAPKMLTPARSPGARTSRAASPFGSGTSCFNGTKKTFSAPPWPTKTRRSSSAPSVPSSRSSTGTSCPFPSSRCCEPPTLPASAESTAPSSDDCAPSKPRSKKPDSIGSDATTSSPRKNAVAGPRGAPRRGPRSIPARSCGDGSIPTGSPATGVPTASSSPASTSSTGSAPTPPCSRPFGIPLPSTPAANGSGRRTSSPSPGRPSRNT